MILARVLGAVVFFSMAAGLHAQVTVYVDDDAPGGGDGSSWDTPYRFLQDALSFASDPKNDVSEIRIGEGTYAPDVDEANPAGTGDRNETFQLIDGVAHNGGYAGFGAGDPNKRDVDAFPTILTGELAGSATRAYHVVTTSDVGEATVLEGVSVVMGFADANSSPNDRGAGVYNIAGSPTISDCTIDANRAHRLGCGMYSSGGDLTLTGVTISNNTQDEEFSFEPSIIGAGLYFAGEALLCINCEFSDNALISLETARGSGVYFDGEHADFIECSFAGNNTVGSCGFTQGGAVYATGTSISFTDCAFDENGALGGACAGTGSGEGGAIHLKDIDTEVIACTFNTNRTLGSDGALGGAIQQDGGTLDLIDCSFIANVADDSFANLGGVLYLLDADTFISGCTFRANACTGGVICSGGAVYCRVDSTVVIVNSLFDGNACIAEDEATGGAVLNRLNCNTTIVNSTFVNNSIEGFKPFAYGGAITSYGATGALNLYNCIVRHNTGNEGDQIALDSGTVNVAYCNVQGGEADVHQTGGTLNWGAGNIDADALFVDPGNDNYRLGRGSPSIDAGDNTEVPADTRDLDDDGDTSEPIPFDLAGNARFVDDPDTEDTGNGTAPLVDMGAFEFSSETGAVAPLVTFFIPFGELISGDLDDLAESDDEYLVARSDPNFTAMEPNLTVVTAWTTAAGFDVNAITITLETSISQLEGTLRIRAYNWNDEGFDHLVTHSIAMDDETHIVKLEDAQPYFSPDSDQFIVVMMRHSVVATFAAAGFDARHDLVEVLVE